LVAFCAKMLYNWRMKKFKYKFSTLMLALIFAAMALSVAGFIVNLCSLISKINDNVAFSSYDILRYVLMFFVTVTLFALLISILAYSCYTVDDKYFKTKFGFIVSKYDLQLIDTLVNDKKTGKLTVTFENGQYMVIVVKQEWYEDFIEALLAANPKIEYSIVSLDKDDPDNEKKS